MANLLAWQSTKSFRRGISFILFLNWLNRNWQNGHTGILNALKKGTESACKGDHGVKPYCLTTSLSAYAQPSCPIIVTTLMTSCHFCDISSLKSDISSWPGFTTAGLWPSSPSTLSTERPNQEHRLLLSSKLCASHGKPIHEQLCYSGFWCHQNSHTDVKIIIHGRMYTRQRAYIVDIRHLEGSHVHWARY